MEVKQRGHAFRIAEVKEHADAEVKEHAQAVKEDTQALNPHLLFRFVLPWQWSEHMSECLDPCIKTETTHALWARCDLMSLLKKAAGSSMTEERWHKFASCLGFNNTKGPVSVFWRMCSCVSFPGLVFRFGFDDGTSTRPV